MAPQIEDPDEEWPIPAMAGHTMTRIDDVHVWVIGGFSATSYYSDTVYEFEASSNTWRELSFSGSQPTGENALVIYKFFICLQGHLCKVILFCCICTLFNTL